MTEILKTILTISIGGLIAVAGIFGKSLIDKFIIKKGNQTVQTSIQNDDVRTNTVNEINNNQNNISETVNANNDKIKQRRKELEKRRQDLEERKKKLEN